MRIGPLGSANTRRLAELDGRTSACGWAREVMPRAGMQPRRRRDLTTVVSRSCCVADACQVGGACAGSTALRTRTAAVPSRAINGIRGGPSARPATSATEPPRDQRAEPQLTPGWAPRRVETRAATAVPPSWAAWERHQPSALAAPQSSSKPRGRWGACFYSGVGHASPAFGLVKS